MFLHTSDQLRFRLGSNADGVVIQTVGLTLRDDVFHHVAVTYDGTTADASGITIHVDGVAASLTVVREDLVGNAANTMPLVIGNQKTTGTMFFTGQLDDFRIFDFELTAGQVTSLFGS